MAAAGILITDEQGHLTKLYPHSGHYRPGEAEMQRVLFYLENQAVDLSTIQVDMQQLVHINREQSQSKKKKTSSLYLLPGNTVAAYLAHKARFIDSGIFDQIHEFEGHFGVRQTLNVIDNGGYWQGFAPLFI